MAKYTTLTSLFTAIANSLRAKTGSTETIIADDFPSVIDSISVGVEGGIVPTGTKTITTNGTHDVKSYANAEVNVPTGITPSGTKSITSNGTHDVTNYASANVNVPSITKIIDINITAQKGGTASTVNTLVSADAFAKEHRSKDGFTVALVPLFQVPATTGAVVSVFHGNRNISAHSTGWRGHGLYWSSATVVAGYQIAGLANASTYQAGFRVNSSGDIILFLPASRYLVDGQYRIVMTVAE